MLDLLGPGSIVGYCTNVHPAGSCDELLRNLQRYTLPVKQRVCPDGAMGVGLWFPKALAKDMMGQGGVGDLAEWLARHGLIPFTLNGFPYGDFHEPGVKHKVYEPRWDDIERVQYTLELVQILVSLLRRAQLPQPIEAGISTLPVGWGPAMANDPDTPDTPNAQQRAAEHLAGLVTYLQWVERQFGMLIHLDLEPEPGCVLEKSADVVAFFEHYLDPLHDAQTNRRFLRVCHDVCHAAVMFEDQREALERYKNAGIQIGKVQVSSALHVPMDRFDRAFRDQAIEELAAFAEDRYLHQTVVRVDGERQFYEDLGDALHEYRTGRIPQGAGPWRVHFHVPLFLDRTGLLETTNREILECLDWFAANPGTTHYEVETYAWSVLPEALRPDDLADGIAREMVWLEDQTGSRYTS